MQVAVVGAGVAGLASAIALRRAGASVTVFERRSGPATGGAGVLLQPSGLVALAAIGGALDPESPAIRRLEGRRRDGKRVLDLDYGRYPAGNGRGVVRATLVNRLLALAEAAGVAFRFASPVTAITGHAGGAALRGVGKGTWDLIVVADGAHSPLRETVAPVDRTRAYDWSALWALVPLPGDWPRDVLQQRYHRGDRMAGILPVAQGRGKPAVGTFFWSVRHDAVTAWRQAPLQEWKAAVLRLWPSLAPIVDAFRTHDDLHVATYRDARPSRWHRGRVVLVGDAAHGTSPQLGNGVTLALGDAVVLARALARAPDIPAGLNAYERERRTAVRFTNLCDSIARSQRHCAVSRQGAGASAWRGSRQASATPPRRRAVAPHGWPCAPPWTALLVAHVDLATPRSSRLATAAHTATETWQYFRKG